MLSNFIFYDMKSEQWGKLGIEHDSKTTARFYKIKSSI